MAEEHSTSDNGSLANLLPILKAYAIELLKHSWLIVLLAVLLGMYLRNRKLSTPTTYTADLSFKVNEEASQTQQNIASLFGGGISKEASSNVSFKRLQELILTRKVMSKVLFHKVELKNDSTGHLEKDLLINHYLNRFYYKPKDLENAYFFESDSIDPLNRRANHLFMYVHNAITRNHLILDPGTGYIMHLKAISSSEDFSYIFINTVYEKLNAYYSELALENKRRFSEMAERRANQLRGKLSEAESKYITYVNTHGAEAGGRKNTLIKTQFLSTDLQKATQSYFSAVANKEAAWVAYEQQKQTPSMSLIDPPLYPLAKAVPNPFLHMVLGGILGGGLGAMLIIGWKFSRDYLLQNKKQAAPEETTA